MRHACDREVRCARVRTFQKDVNWTNGTPRECGFLSCGLEVIEIHDMRPHRKVHCFQNHT